MQDVLALAKRGIYLKEFLDFGYMAPVVLFLFQLPLLAAYALAILVVLGATSNFTIRCILGVLALMAYTMAVFYKFAMEVVAG